MSINPTFSTHTFPVQEVMERQNSHFFVAGKQIEVDKQQRRIEKTPGQNPATNWDYVKHALVSWNPSLCFGWLVPKYRPIKVTFEYVESVACLNVIPTHSMGDEVMRIIEYEDDIELSSPIEKIDWLLGQPPTPAQVEKARERIRKARCSERFAFYMARGGR